MSCVDVLGCEDDFFAADGVRYPIRVTVDPAMGLVSLAGLPVTAVAHDLFNNRFEGVVSPGPTDNTRVVTFDLPAGTYRIQHRVIPPATDGFTLVPVVEIHVQESY